MAAAPGNAADGADASQERATDGDSQDISEVVVTGYRTSLRNAVELKRNSSVMMDAINAEDIADFPDANLAESLQRLPVSRWIATMARGARSRCAASSSDFTLVRLNGLEAQSTAASSDSVPRPIAAVDSTSTCFASDLFSSLQVTKTASASTDEGFARLDR